MQLLKMVRYQKPGVKLASQCIKGNGDALECGSYRGIKM